MAIDLKPTRSELVKLKLQIKLARSGHSLLKKKHDGLILEFFELLKRAKNARAELAAKYSRARQALDLARVMHTDLKLHSLGLAVTEAPALAIETKNIMGVKVLKISTGKIEKTILERGAGVVASTAIIDEAMAGYEQVVEQAIITAEAEAAMKRLLQEIEKTKRRVNALEFNRIPALEESRKFITLRLEEMERENVFRLKRIKKKT